MFYEREIVGHHFAEAPKTVKALGCAILPSDANTLLDNAVLAVCVGADLYYEVCRMPEPDHVVLKGGDV